MYPYVKSTGVYKCPDDSIGANGRAVPISYAVNAVVTNNAAGTGASTLSMYRSPAKTVLLAEAFGVQTDPTGASGIDTASGATLGCKLGAAAKAVATRAAVAGGSLTGRVVTGPLLIDTAYKLPNCAGIGSGADCITTAGVHSEGANYIFADGHVKFLKPGAVTAGFDNPTSGNCGAAFGGPAALAANTECADPKVAATFSFN